MQIKLYCGNYYAIPQSISDSLEIVGSDTRQDGNFWVEYGQKLYDKALLGHRVHIFTNNDHVLNGLRVAVMKDNQPRVRSFFYLVEEIEILFYEKEGHHQSMLINSDGAISNWPPGFFDATENALMQLF